VAAPWSPSRHLNPPTTGATTSLTPSSLSIYRCAASAQMTATSNANAASDKISSAYSPISTFSPHTPSLTHPNSSGAFSRNTGTHTEPSIYSQPDFTDSVPPDQPWTKARFKVSNLISPRHSPISILPHMYSPPLDPDSPNTARLSAGWNAKPKQSRRKPSLKVFISRSSSLLRRRTRNLLLGPSRSPPLTNRPPLPHRHFPHPPLPQEFL